MIIWLTLQRTRGGPNGWVENAIIKYDSIDSDIRDAADAFDWAIKRLEEYNTQARQYNFATWEIVRLDIQRTI